MLPASPSHPADTLEIERKFEVWRDIQLPTDLDHLGFTVSDQVTFYQTATYFDTESRALAQRGIAVRRRTGGADDGWHMKVRTPHGTRELQWPDTSEVPAGLIAEATQAAGQDSITFEAIAEIAVVRTRVLLSDGRGQELAELVDDRVRATDHAHGAVRVWREWEVELRDGTPLDLFHTLGPHLISLGASPSASDSKIGRAVGRGAARATAKGEPAGVLAWHALTDVADLIAGATERGAAEDARVMQLRALAETMLTREP